MGGKSKSSQKTSNTQSTNNIVNDGDYAGVGGNVTHDESSVDFDYEDSSDYSQNYDIDNSVRYDLDQDIDNSVRNDIDQDYDNSVNNDGELSGNHGTINVLDGGAIEGAFDFGKEAIKESSETTREAINQVSSTATSVVNSLVDSQNNSFRTFEKVAGDAFTSVNKATEQTLTSLENVSSEYATGLGELSNSFAEELSGVQVQNMNNNKEQLAAIGELARNTALQGQDIVAENSSKMVLYFMGGTALIAVLAIGATVLRNKK